MTKKSSLGQEEIATGRTMSRRAMTMLGGLTLGAASALGAVGCCFGGVPSVGSGCSDQDPTDGLGRGTHCANTGCTDSDPSDGVGSGRNCGGTAAPPAGGAAPTPAGGAAPAGGAPPAGGTTP